MNILTISFLFLLLAIFSKSEKYYLQPRTFNLINPYRRFLEQYEESKKNEPDYQKNYKNETFLRMRQANFERMDEIIKNHNEDFKLGLVTYSRKLMMYSDWNPELKKQRLCGTRMAPQPRSLTNIQLLKTIRSWPKLPPNTEVNNCIFPNPVRDQQTCGCCWAFASITVIEGVLKIVRNTDTKLSIQQMVDCDLSNEGCNGGWPTSAFEYMILNGVTDGDKYPYINAKQQSCRKAGLKNVLPQHHIVKPIEIDFKGDEESYRKLLHRIKVPVVGAIHANEALMSAYTGKYKNETCPKKEPNHAIIVCGFGTDKSGEGYWIMRNSWSPFWGENGYIRMAENNTCGIANYAMYPVIVGAKNLDPFMGEAFEREFSQRPNRRGKD